MNRWRKNGWARAALATVAVSTIALTGCGPLQRDVTVDSTADAVDAAPGDGVCATAGGECTLRAAVMEAAATPTVHTTVHLPAGAELVLGLAGAGDDTGATGDLDVHGLLTIDGQGAVIDGAGADRVVDQHDGELTIEDVTIRNGWSNRGSGVLVRGQVWVRRSLLENHIVTAPSAGSAIHQISGGTSIEDSEIHTSTSFAVAGAGAVLLDGGGMVIERSTVAESTGPLCPPSGIPASGRQCTDPDLVLDPGAERVGITAGIVNRGGTLVVTSSTVSANAAPVVRTGCAFTPRPVCTVISEIHLGDGVVTEGGYTQIYRSTLLGNHHSVKSPTTTTVVSGSVLESCWQPVTSDGYNVDTDGSCVGSGAATDVTSASTGVDAALSGPVPRSHTPVAAPALSGIPLGTATLCDATLPLDQRGAPSPQGGACERGSVEL